jgi:hypothetical protein
VDNFINCVNAVRTMPSWYANQLPCWSAISASVTSPVRQWLPVNSLLMKAAQDHTQDQANTKTMSHTGSNGSSMANRIGAVGYNWSKLSENVAFGYGTPLQTALAWMCSDGHRANIMDCSINEFGAGIAADSSGTKYYTLDFGCGGWDCKTCL